MIEIRHRYYVVNHPVATYGKDIVIDAKIKKNRDALKINSENGFYSIRPATKEEIIVERKGSKWLV